jgi:hypothetical protein
LGNKNWWVGLSDREVALWQLAERRLCCPFSVFHAAVESACRRPVWTHEFTEPGVLIDEIRGVAPTRTVVESMRALERAVAKGRKETIEEARNRIVVVVLPPEGEQASV